MRLLVVMTFLFCCHAYATLVAESAIVRCPDIACLAIYIPPECAEPTYSTYRGKICLSCPRNKCPNGYPVTDI
ncbi:hypothetical protein ACJMK2_043228 [Sinanodonta woodiana]|uniref:Uncharacterized protein n=1 Tax=Sinanodonta woodiana TaxID=1069815 RepID=A0ABD3VW88_SINWO